MRMAAVRNCCRPAVPSARHRHLMGYKCKDQIMRLAALLWSASYESNSVR
jgi:hypothetical protein